MAATLRAAAGIEQRNAREQQRAETQLHLPHAPGRPRQAGQQGGSSDTPPDTDEGSSMRRSMNDADAIGRETSNGAQGYLQDARGEAGSVADSARTCARNAVDAAGEKIQGMREQAGDLRVKGRQYVVDEPIKAILCAAAGGALITALLLALSAPRR